MEKLSSMKPVPCAEKIRDRWTRRQIQRVEKVFKVMWLTSFILSLREPCFGLQYCTFAWRQHLLSWWFSYFRPPVKGNVLILNLIISCDSFLYPIIPPDFLASVVNRSLPLRSILSFFLDTHVTPEPQLESVFPSSLVTLWSKLNSYQWNELEW